MNAYSMCLRLVTALCLQWMYQPTVAWKEMKSATSCESNCARCIGGECCLLEDMEAKCKSVCLSRTHSVYTRGTGSSRSTTVCCIISAESYFTYPWGRKKMFYTALHTHTPPLLYTPLTHMHVRIGTLHKCKHGSATMG
jgi:hypothetical protein